MSSPIGSVFLMSFYSIQFPGITPEDFSKVILIATEEGKE